MTASPLLGAQAPCRPSSKFDPSVKRTPFRPTCDCGWRDWQMHETSEIAYQRAERHVRQVAETSSEKGLQP